MCTSIILSLGSSMCSSPYSGDPGTAESIAALTNLTFNKHIIYYMMYDTISCNIINMSNQKNVLHTSGAMRSRSRKVKVRSKILTRTLSPIMCLPVCLSTYMSMKCVAYAEVTSTMVKEESNELDQSLRRVQVPLILAQCIRHHRPVWTTIK